MARELLDRLCGIFVSEAGAEKSEHVSGTTIASTEKRMRGLISSWSGDMESYLTTIHKRQQTKAHSLADKHLTEEADNVPLSLQLKVSMTLHTTLLDLLQGQTLDHRSSSSSGRPHQNLDNTTTTVDDHVLRLWNDQDTDDNPKRQRWHSLEDVAEVLRASKNFLRWFLDTQLEQQQRQRFSSEESVVLSRWQTHAMLKLYMLLLEDLQQHSCPTGAQCASQILFYSTFAMTTTVPNSLTNNNNNNIYESFILQGLILKRLLILLLRQKQFHLSLTLSLVRNIHTALVTLPRSELSVIETVQVQLKSEILEAETVQWIKQIEDSAIISFQVAFRELLFFLLCNSNERDTTEANNVDDNNSPTKSIELVIEVFRCCYALRAGPNSMMHPRWQSIIHQLLTLNPQSNGQYYECQLNLISILMDASTEVLTCNLLSDNIDRTLVHILETQVSSVLKNNLVDDRAASTLAPILVVLYNCCRAGTSFALTLQRHIFPDTETFRHAVAAEEKRTGHQRAVNMSPLDAPEGTLRAKLIQMLTSPQSLVKRLTGELLFLLCHAEQQTFVRRVGLGNAIPLLSSKGLIQIT